MLTVQAALGRPDAPKNGVHHFFGLVTKQTACTNFRQAVAFRESGAISRRIADTALQRVVTRSGKIGARKLLPRILKSDLPREVKVEASKRVMGPIPLPPARTWVQRS